MEDIFEFDARSRVGSEPAGGSYAAGWQSPRISFSTGFADMGLQEVPSLSCSREESSGCDDDSEASAKKQEKGEDHSSEFEFCILDEFTCVSEGSMLPADELFYKGQLLPLQQSRRSLMVELLSSSSSFSSSSSSSSTDISSKVRKSNPAVHYKSAPFPYPIVSSPQAVRCPPQETPLSSPFPYPIASSTQSGNSSVPKLPGVYLPPTSKCRRCSMWKEVLGSFRRANKGSGQKPGLDAAVDDCDHSFVGKSSSGSKRPKVLRMLFRGNGHGHCHGQQSTKEEPNMPQQPLEDHEQGLLDAGAESGSDVSGSFKASISCSDGPGAGRSPFTSDAPLSMPDTVPVGRLFEACRPYKTRDAGAGVRATCSPGRRSPGRLSPGRVSPGRVSPGRVSPSRVSVKVGDRFVSRRSAAVGRIVLKNLERVSSPTKRGMGMMDRENRQSDKAGLYTASVKVMPVLNVPGVSIKPALRGANVSSKSRITDLKQLFTRKETAPSPSAPLLDHAKTS